MFSEEGEELPELVFTPFLLVEPELRISIPPIFPFVNPSLNMAQEGKI